MKIILASSTLIRRSAVLAMVVAFCTVAQAQSVLPAEKLSDSALHQISALLQEKATRTPAQTKMDSQLVYAAKRHRNELIAANVPNLQVGVKSQPDDRILVDLDAKVNKELLAQIELVGGKVIDNFPQYNAIRALVPVDQIEGLAGRPDVQFIRQAAEAQTNAGSVDSQGDTTHRAIGARSTYGVDGTGVNIGVLSDSADCLTNSINTGDLPATVTVLPGQWGSGYGEGTAMMEIIHDLAPGAGLFFATAFNSEASFAANISNLWAAGCNIIVDDVGYFDEPPFQDGIVAQSVNFVTSHGALYFSSAANSGNKTDGTSGTWEGNFSNGGAVGFPEGGTIHNFGGGTNYDVITSSGTSGYIFLFWSDPFNTANTTNDFDLFILDSTGSSVLYSSTTRQTGLAPAYEYIYYSSSVVNDRLVVVKFSGADRFLHVDTNRGRLQINTSGNTHGHNAAATAFCVAATPAAAAYGPPTPAGPYPNPFNTGNAVESFSSDGPRRIFYNPDNTPITPGNFLSTGGLLLQKPDLTAADGVTTTVNCKGEPFAPFYGTSAAAPHAAAIAGLLRSYRPLLTTNQLWAALTNSASTIDIMTPGWDPNSGSGIVMADLVLQSASSSGPLLVADGSTLTAEGCTPTNGVIDPNETVTVNFALQNVGGKDASNVVATLLATGGVTSPSGAQNYGTLLAGGGAVFEPFTFTANGTCGSNITATLQIQTNAVIYGTVNYTFSLGGTGTSFSQNFDGVSAPTLPGGWSTSAGGSESPWVTSTATADTAPNAAFSPDPAAIGSNALVSPVIPIATSTAKLTFRNNYSLETSYDGGVLDIKIGAGAFQDILTAGGSFASGAYTYTISTSFGNPVGGRQAWSGSSGGFITTVVNLPPSAAGQNIQLRWMCGSDNSVGYSGWYIDTISINDGFACCTGTVSAAPFRITSIVSSNNNILINWTTGIGQTNALQATAGTANGSYATNSFANIFIVTNTVTTATNYTDVGAATNIPSRFYRVRLVP